MTTATSELGCRLRSQTSPRSGIPFAIRHCTSVSNCCRTDSVQPNAASVEQPWRQAALEAGLGSNNTSKILVDSLERFRTVNFDDSLLAARALVKQDDAVAALPHFGRGRRSAVEAGTALATAAKAFLDAVDQNLTTYGQSHDSKQGALTNSLSRIDASLQTIEANLIQMSGSIGKAANAA